MPDVSPTLPTLLTQYIDQSQNSIAILDANDIFIYCNPAFKSMFGFSDGPLGALSHAHFMQWMYERHQGVSERWPNLESWQAYVRTRYRSAPFRSFEVDLASGEWLLVTEQTLPGGEVVMLSSNITSQKETERSLRIIQEKMTQLALTDELTGVPNRRSFLSSLEYEVEKSRRYGHLLSVAMLDLDHFKHINDRHGHAAGDEVLRHFAGFIRAKLRTVDIMGRLGGEEFALILPDTSAESAASAIERMLVALKDEPAHTDSGLLPFTFSAGVAQWRSDVAAEPRHLLSCADEALYSAKESGRSRVCVYQTGT